MTEQVSPFELGKFQGEVNARLDGLDADVDELKTEVGKVNVTCTDIKLMLAKQNGLRSIAKTTGAGAGGAGFIVGLITLVSKFL